MDENLKRILKYLLIFLLVVGIGYVIYKLVELWGSVKNVLNAFKVAWFNTRYCGQKECNPPAETLDPPLPSTINTNEWDQNLARYVADGVYKIASAATDKVDPVAPADLTIIKELYNNKDDPIFGLILSGGGAIWILFRGTQTASELIQDITYSQDGYLKPQDTSQVKIKFLTKEGEKEPAVHAGFIEAYENMRQDILDTLESANLDKTTQSIVVGGHSLGAAVATLAGADLKQQGYKSVVVYASASPRVGDQTLCDIITKMNLILFRIVNTADAIPTFPPAVSPNFKDINSPYDYAHCGILKAFSNNWLSTLNNHMLGNYMQALLEMTL